MNKRLAAPNSTLGLSKPILLIVMSMLLAQISAAQNPSVYEGNAHPASTPVTRDNGCESWMAHSYAPEVERLGRAYAQRVESTSKLITDPVIAEYVNRVAQNLLRDSDSQLQLTLKILNTDEVSAFSLPGGWVFIDSGLILAADSEAELAGVISHEIAHLAACHAAQDMAREELTDTASMPLILRIVFRRAIRTTIYLKPDGNFETEADFLAVKYLYEAGYDPEALASFFEKARAREKQNGSRGAIALDGHPPLADRIKRTHQEIKALVPAASEYKLDTSEFQEMKKRLAELHNPRIDTNQGVQNPVLLGSSTMF